MSAKFCDKDSENNGEHLCNVSPYVPRRPLERDESIVLELEIFSWQVYEVVIYMLVSLTICP